MLQLFKIEEGVIMSVEIIDTSKEIIEEAKSGLKRIIYIENEIKVLRNEIKEVKKEMKEKGVELKLFNKAYSYLKKQVKEKADPIMKDAIVFAEEIIDDDTWNSLDELINNQ
jgi:uncharacterized protein (UPF0335 family)